MKKKRVFSAGKDEVKTEVRVPAAESRRKIKKS
jgi:hypothetical protein